LANEKKNGALPYSNPTINNDDDDEEENELK